MGISETPIQSALLKALSQLGIFALRLNSGRVKTMGGWVHLCEAGTADILSFPEGLPPLWIEVKKPKGLQEDEQKKFEAKVVALGHGYAVARSLDDLMWALVQHRKKRSRL